MMAYLRRPFDRELDDSAHWQVDLLAAEREALLALLESDKRPSIAMRQYIARKLKDAPRREGPPLPVAALDWRRAEREAHARGESLADYVWDGGRPPPDEAA